MKSTALTLTLAVMLPASVAGQARVFSHADTLWGTNGPARTWWDAAFYDLRVRLSPADSTISGSNDIYYDVVSAASELQLDLRRPLEIDSILQDGAKLATRRDGDAFFVTLRTDQRPGTRRRFTVYYHGKVGLTPPTAFIWARDSLGAPWIATSDEDLGASTWWPLKDYPGDEPDSQRIAITVPDPMLDVSNGRLRTTTRNSDGTTTYEWFVTEPLNSYAVALNTDQHYVHWSDVYHGESGDLTLDYWPLSYHLAASRTQFQQVKTMLQCYEHWFGPYPWYPDGYKLIETPYLGMEHQSGIAYGNRYRAGYLGQDLSGTGVGLLWDYIIVHESAHEWFGNSISARDHADMWLHESFAMYAEDLFTECQQNKAAGERYLVGVRAHIRNDLPIVGHYGVHDVPASSDRYFKGANLLMMIREVIDNDEKWRGILRGLNQTFRHKTVSGQEVEDYISRAAGLDLSKIFAQYLTTTQIPTLEYRLGDSTLAYRWTNSVPGFDMPVRVSLDGSANYTVWLRPQEKWQSQAVGVARPVVKLDERFYVRVNRIE